MHLSKITFITLYLQYLYKRGDVDMSRKKVFIVTASKGGSGKTPLALSLYLACVFSGKRVAGLDLNINNPDFSDILKMTGEALSKSPLFIVSQRAINSIRYNVLRVEEDALIAFNEYPRMISVKDLWHEIYDLLIVNEATAGFDAVIDTGFNFYVIEPPINDMTNELFKKYEFFFFHIWSISSGIKKDNPKYKTSRLDNFQIVINRFRQLNGLPIDGNIIHCFTPQVFVDRNIASLLKYWKSGEFMYQKLKFGLSDKILTFKQLRTLLDRISIEILKFPGGTYGLDHRKIMEVWVDVVKAFIKDNFARKMPQNLLLVPNVYVSLATIATDLMLLPGKTLEAIKKKLGKFYDEIHAYLVNTPLFRKYFR